MLIRRRLGVRKAPLSFSDGVGNRLQTTRIGIATSLTAIATAEQRNRALVLRLEAARRRTDTRGWVVLRRERTRHLIELGGLVQKAGLVDLADDDRATIYGALLDLVSKARDDVTGDALLLWRRRGKRAFDLEASDQTLKSQAEGDPRTKVPLG